jgi:hypothetical protein
MGIAVAAMAVVAIWRNYPWRKLDDAGGSGRQGEATSPSHHRPDITVSEVSQQSLAVVHTFKTRDQEGFPILQFTLRNNATESQIITRVDVAVVQLIPVIFGGGGPFKTRPLRPLAVWDLDLSKGQWEEIEEGKQRLTGVRARKELTLCPPEPVLIAADDAATIRVRLFDGFLHPWPDDHSIPQPDEQSQPDDPLIPRAPMALRFWFVSDRETVAKADSVKIP